MLPIAGVLQLSLEDFAEAVFKKLEKLPIGGHPPLQILILSVLHNHIMLLTSLMVLALMGHQITPVRESQSDV
jgi:hypothetical protein